MDLNKNAWYVRLFFFALDAVDEFFDRGFTAHRYKRGTNLCHFVRTICFYLPLVILCHLWLVAIFIVSLTLFPIRVFGWKWYAITIGTIGLIVGIVIGGIKLLEFWENRLLRESGKKSEQPSDKPAKKISVNKELTGPSFASILWEWLVANKKKICPQVNFLTTGKEE